MKIVSPNASELVREVVRDFVNFVGTTYGPVGKKVLIQNNFSVKAVDDGKLVAEEYELKDESKNAIASYIKEALSKTDARVGDGTTTAAILTGAIVEGILTGNALTERSPEDIALLQSAALEAVKQIEKLSKPVKTKEELYKVAFNSYNNEEVAKLVADTVFEVGKDGVVSVEDSPTVKTECEIVQGTEIKKGYASPYFINDGDKVTLKNPRILLANKRLESLKELVPLLQKVVASGNKSLVLIAEGFSDEVIGSLVMSKIQGILQPLIIENPMFGEHRIDFLEDVASVCGAIILDDKTGITLATITLDDLGEAQSLVAKKDSTVLTGGKGKKSVLNAQISKLRKRLELSTNAFEKDTLSKRIAVLAGGVAVLKIGADTENEQKTKKLKVDDAVSAAKVAFKNGVVEGGGRTYEKLKTSSPVLNEALKAPRKKLEENGKEFLDDKVVDPTDVLIAALESAVSIATGLVTLGGVIATKREKKRDDIDY